MTAKRNTQGLSDSAQRKRQETFKKVDKGIQQLIKTQHPITFSAVAEAAGVSKAWLYKEASVKQRIEQLRDQSRQTGPSQRRESASEKSLRGLNQTLRNRLQTVEAENRELRRQNEIFGGYLLRIRELEKQLQHLEAENQQLKHLKTGTTHNTRVYKQDLNALGIKLNSTLRNLIRATPNAIVETAIQALEEALSRGLVSNPGGFLHAAVKDCWQPNESLGNVAELDTFNEWWRWAYDQGLVKAATQIDGVQHVLTADEEWLPLDTALTRYPMDTAIANPPLP
ncbi:transposition regulatory protein [Leptolyngbya sp. Heron Island J]|uniref:DUF6262 family protein n=1 Tax=Leptolyngbya sp. Heron Island J TaxID=1385935 RepID=UPI0003B95617|nr:DUF6262 family protein [Leptolyngbya sp. Heron Island J]ESA37956.1 transposition regulatory protein [Leptolyngbya sp. Heron Island J]